MSQPTDPKAKAAEGAKKAESILCPSFTEQSISSNINPFWLLLQLQNSGVQYQPQTPMGLQARAFLIEDIKLFIANYYTANGVSIEEDETAAKQINAWFEASLIKSNPYFAQLSGAISQERLQELMSVTGMMVNPFGSQMGMGGMGMGMPGMMGGMGGMMPGMGMGGMAMPGMMGGMGMGMPQQQQAGVPLWKKQSAPANGQKQQQQPQYPGMMGMGMGGMMPGMGMGGMMPGMGMGGMGMGMGMPGMMGMGGMSL